jgi:thiol-disulfide isomerase/thioredoxin
VRRHWRVLALLAGLFAAAPSWTMDIRIFEPGSMDAIRAARTGQPFALVFWSLDCSHCREEFPLLASAKRRRPTLDLILVSTDAPEARAEIARTLEAAGLGRAEAWVFGAEAPERLRWAIDRKWRGELPRTYLFDASHQAIGISGKLPGRRLTAWMQAGLRR